MIFCYSDPPSLGKVFNFVVFPFQLNEGDPVKKLKIAFIVEKVAQKSLNVNYIRNCFVNVRKLSNFSILNQN